MEKPRQLVLASGSRYRRELLTRLALPFEVAAPNVDESPLPRESPRDTAQRLARLKAHSLQSSFPAALIIGSDQVASLEGERIGKPGNHAAAVAQLKRLSGKAADFDTAVCLLDAASGEEQVRVVPCRVQFRSLDANRIEAYLRREQPYDCAGSAKAEGLGIALIARIDTEDPTSLIGLPLIALTEMLSRAGFSVL